MAIFIDNMATEEPQRLAEIVSRWQLISEPSSEFALLINKGRLELRSRSDAKMGAICVDFNDPKLSYRCKHGGGRTEAIAKAVGIQGEYRPSIIDATAGLGKDAFILASLGCVVTMVERNPVVAALLEDGLSRASQVPLLSNWLADHLTLIHGTSKDKLRQLNQQAEVVYLDPMFPHRQKSALVKKEMQCFQKIVGEDMDADELLMIARRAARSRVVVKRPIKALFLGNLPPAGAIKTKGHRFDIYSSLTD